MIIDPASWRLARKPSFVVFEGINGAGKSTLLRGLANHLRTQSQRVVETREPGGTELGILLRQIVQETPHLHPDPVSELLLFSADRSEHVRKLITPSLANGSWVLSDRFFYSSMAFQGYGRGMDLGPIESVTNVAVGSVAPDLVVLVDLSPAEALNRLGLRDGREIGTKDRFEREGIEFHERIREGFLELARNRPEPFLLLDGMSDAASLLNETITVVGGGR